MPQTLEERVALIEKELEQLRQQLPPPQKTGWRKLLGAFDNDPDFDEIIRLGKEYRNSQVPNYDEIQP